MNPLINESRPGLVLLRQILIAVLWVSAVSLLGQMLTDLGPWYRGLRQPDWKPPDWAFGVIWTSIFVLLVIAGVMAWRKTLSDAQRVQLLALFGINSMLHVLWSFLFFTAKRPDWSMWELPLLWLSILALIVTIWRLSRVASLLLLPYLVWVTIAGFLNYANVQLNGPFDRSAVQPSPSATESPAR
jgi:tryptophan-rich sensory protein